MTTVVSSLPQKRFTFLDESGLPDFERAVIAAIIDATEPPARDQDAFNLLKKIVVATGRLPFALSGQEKFYIAKAGGPASSLAYLTYRYKFRASGREKLAFDFPSYLLIEPVSTCNLRCPMCFQVDRSFTKKPYMGMMSMELFRSVIDQAANEGCYAVTLASRGEPLLHPQIGDLLDYASSKKRFFDIKLNTNGTRLTEELCHRILASDVTMLVFSIDHYLKESYEKIRVNADFDAVRRNVDMLLDIKQRDYPNSACEVRISGVRVDAGMDEEAFRQFWGEGFGNITLSDMIERWDTYANDRNPENVTACNLLWDRMYVWFDGKCNPCDVDYKSNLSYGDANTQSLKDIWNGPELSRLREMHASGRRSELVPCDRCELRFG